MNQIDTIPLSDNAPVKMATVMTFADGITWRMQTVNLTHEGAMCNKSDAAALNQLENRSQIGSDAHKPRVPEPIPAERGDGAPEEPAMSVRSALDLAWCLTILSPNIAHIVLWTAILLGVPTRKGGKLAGWFQLAVWTLVLTFCPPVQAAQAGALKHPFGSESREAFIDLSAPQVGHKLPLWPIKAAEMRLCARVKRMRRSMARSPLRLQRHLLLRRPAPLFK